jgi:predicted secreted acid phosphatase
VMARYNVLMLFGDNLRDFSEVFASPDLPEGATTADYLTAIDARAAAVDDAICHWGLDWFVLPNPIYGEWEGLMGPNPSALFEPSGMGPVE